MRLLKSIASSTISTPLRNVPLRNARNAPPIPPAAPAPATGTISIPYFCSITLANDAIPLSSDSTISGDAPFCGANTYAAPIGPQKGVSTSHAIVNVDSRTSVGTCESSICAMSPSIPPQQRSISLP